MTLKTFSMFTGIGGFELGIEQSALDSELVGYSEIDGKAIQVFEEHFEGVKNYGDAAQIRGDQLPKFDLLVAGFPCQPFSHAGKKRGFLDARGTLFFDIARILHDKKPRYLVLENVLGLLHNTQGKTFQTILGILADLGYTTCEWQVLNSKDFGLPQNRNRVFIVGYFGAQPRRTLFCAESDGRSDERIIGREVTFPLTTSYSKGPAASDVPKRRRQLVGLDVLERSNEGEPSFTLTAQDRHGVIVKNPERSTIVRRLTPLECERLQGFPDAWTASLTDPQRYFALGNAVSVPVIKAVMDALAENIAQEWS